MSMEMIISFIKEYDYLFTIVLSAIAALFAVLTYMQAKRNDKENIRRKIAEKQAQLNALDGLNGMLNHTTMSDNISKSAILRSEIEELKKML